MSKRQIVAILMLSPLYFTMTLRQRLCVFKDLCPAAFPGPAAPSTETA
jgi:hypothetical protein